MRSAPTLSIPDRADFGFCPVGETATFEITIKNTTREETEFVWLYKDPFKISPSHGTIAGKKTQTLTITFLPDTATRFDGTIICRFGKNLLESAELKVVGVAKVPHISLSTEAIDFGRVPSGAKATQSLTVHNSAPVPATVDIVSDFNQFQIQPTKIHLQPESSASVKITFHPTNFDFFAFANILFSTAGGNSASMRCSAYVTGPEVSIDKNYINLGNVQLKSKSSSMLNIQNHSDRRVFFQFMIEPTSAFFFEPNQGILAPNYSKSIRITFTPEYPIAYYRRVTLLIHQHHPIAIDVFGSAYDTFTIPPRLKVSHIEANRCIIADGLQNKPPHLLPKINNPQLPTVDFISADLRRNPCTLQSGAHLFDELFSHSDLVTMSASNFEFGQCVRDISPEPQILAVKNNTDGALTLFWQTNSDGLVTVDPPTTEIAKHQSAELKVKFNPLLEFQFMGATLEGFAQYKEMRNKNIVEFPTIPFLLLPFVNGHTMDDVTSFIPTMFTSHKTLVFAGSIAGDSNYQTFFVENRGDCAFKFDVRVIEAEKPDKNALASSSAAFSVYPQVGTIRKGSFQIFVVRFSPAQRGHYHAHLFAQINDSPANSFSVQLKGDASVPAVSFSTMGTLFLHPVSLGSISSQTIKITNDSSVPMRLEWKIPSVYLNLLIVTPQTAEIKSHEIIDCVWEFHPDAVGEFRVEVVCNVQALAGSSHAYVAKQLLPFIVGNDGMQNDPALFSSLRTVQHYPLTICTLVTDCIVNSKPTSIDFGFVRINSAAVSTLSISNHSDSQMHFLLQSSSPQKLLQFSPADDVLPPRSSREVEVRFTPKCPGDVTDSILCSLLNESIYQQDCAGGKKKSIEKLIVKSSVSEICKVSGIGCFPHLSIVDVFSQKYSRSLIWENSSCNAINDEMNLLGCNSLTDDLKQFVVDFGFDTVDAEPTSISIRFKNVGHIAFNFSINFPNDVSIDPEYWALPDEIDPNQLKQDQIMQAKLFRVSEKKFHLEPNESCNVTFTYSHKFIESHQLPVVLSVQNGRIIRLLLKGTTLDPSLPYLVNYRPIVDLQPVPIGSMQPAVQLMQIFNASLTEADFRIDLTQVQECNETNHNFEIFKCLNPLGTVKPRTFANIQWIFKPLEAIQYEVSILCVVSNGNSFTVTLRGRGVHTDQEECTVTWETAPPKSLVIEDASPVKISEQYLMFGDMPVFASKDRVIYVTNTSRLPLTFNTDLQSDCVRLDPDNGTLEPGECRKMLLTINAPQNPMIFASAIPLYFSEPHTSVQRDPTMEELADEEQILYCDPPIDTSNVRSSKIGTLQSMKGRSQNPDEWKSVGERTLELSQKTKQMNTRLFSTHIGKRGTEVSKVDGPKYTAIQYIDIAFNAMTKNEYRDRYGSLDTYFFTPENPTKAEPNAQHHDEVADVLGSIVDEALADEQVRKLAMKEAMQRRLHIPLFSQLYSKDPEIVVPTQETPSLAGAENVEDILHKIIDEIVDEATQGKFKLDKEIIQVSGFKQLS